MSEHDDEAPRPAPETRGADVAKAKTNRKPDRPEAGAEASEGFEGERIAKAIARAGIASRRDAEALIEAGRVTLNGMRLDSPAVNVTDADHIAIDGEPLPARERTRLWIFHKPRGVVTTARDPEGRQTVFDALPEELPRVVAIGRLDINTEGLLLLTNDGGLAKVIAHPDTGWLRRYRVRAFGDVTQEALDRLRKGVTIEGMEYGPVEASLDRAQGDNVWLTLGLREGKNREVKRILEHLGLSVNRLIRLSFGPFQLGELEQGLVEEVRTKVLKDQLGNTLSAQAGVDFVSPVRAPIAPFGSPKAAARSARAAEGEGTRSGDGPERKRAGAGRPAPRGDAPRTRPGARPLSSARPAAPARVPTGGNAAGPRRSVWRADEDENHRSGGVPRRGADPKAARASAAERGRERVGAIKSGDRRVLVERLQPSPEAPAPEPHRRVRFRPRPENEGGAPRAGGRGERPEGERTASDRPPARRGPPRDGPPGSDRTQAGWDARREGGGGPRPGGNRDAGFKRGPRNEGAPRDRGFEERGSPRGAGGPARDGFKAGFKGGRGSPGGGKPDGAKFGEKPAGSRFAGERSGGGRPGGNKPGGNKPGGGKPGGAKFAGSRPGGSKPGGSKFGGSKPGPGGGPKGGPRSGGGGRPGGGARPGGRPGSRGPR